MKRLIPVAIALSLLACPLAIRAEVTDRIVAIVNDDIVTLREVEKYVAVEKRSQFSSMNEYLTNMALREKLDSFIENLLISQQARKLKVEVGDREVEGAVEDIKKQNMITDSELREQLKIERIEYKDFVEGIKLNMVRRRVLARAVAQDVAVDDASLKAYYDSHVQDYTEEEYVFQHIFVSGKRGDARQRAGDALVALEKGGSFGEVAQEFSDEPSKGDVGSAKKEDLIPELREALKLLSPGEFSRIILTPYGYHILKLVEVKKGSALAFEDVKEKVKDAIFRRESEKRYKEYVAKLRAASYVEVKI